MNYVIVPASELSSVDFSEVLESADTLRYSLDGSSFILKYKGSQPFSLIGKTEYTHEEILSILSGPEWTPSE